MSVLHLRMKLDAPACPVRGRPSSHSGGGVIMPEPPVLLFFLLEEGATSRFSFFRLVFLSRCETTKIQKITKFMGVRTSTTPQKGRRLKGASLGWGRRTATAGPETDKEAPKIARIVTLKLRATPFCAKTLLTTACKTKR